MTTQSVAQQSPHLNRNGIAKLLEKSFFTPRWSQDEVIKNVQIAYDSVRARNLTGNQVVIVDGERITIGMKADGTFDTAFGDYRYTVDEFYSMMKRGEIK